MSGSYRIYPIILKKEQKISQVLETNQSGLVIKKKNFQTLNSRQNMLLNMLLKNGKTMAQPQFCQEDAVHQMSVEEGEGGY